MRRARLIFYYFKYIFVFFILKKMKRAGGELNAAAYSRVLKSSRGLTMGKIQGAPACCFLQDYKGKGIVANKYRHVYTLGEHARVCDCPAMQDSQKLIAASSSPSILHLTDECLHIKTLDKLGESIDKSPVAEYGPIAVLGNALSVAESDAPFARVVVEIDAHAKKYVCAACTFQRHTCKHVQSVVEYVDEHNLHGVDPFLPMETNDAYLDAADGHAPASAIPESVSKRPISIDSLVEMVRRRNGSSERPSDWLARGRECVPPADGQCAGCATPWSESNLVVAELSGKLYGCSEMLEVTVYERQCQCGEKRVYDGWEDGVFNMSNKTLWLHETMMIYADLMVEACMPFNAYFKVLERQYERRGKSDLCSKSTVISSLEAFIGLLDVDYDHCFSCPICSQLPAEDQVFIIDGKCMGFRRDLMRPAPVAEGHEPLKASTIPGTTFAYITGDKKAQKLCGKLRAYSKGILIDDGEFSSMVNLARDKAPELVDVLKFIKGGHSYLVCPKRYRQFLYDVASPCPVSCLIPRSLYAEVGGMRSALAVVMEKESLAQEDLAGLMEWGSLSVVLEGMDAVPNAFKPLLARLLELARLPGSYIGDAASSVRVDMGLEDDDEMSFFPNNPKIRSVRDYDDKDGGKEEVCTKHVKKSKRFTAGLFSVFCPHGIAIGFEAMRTFESPRIPFKIFYERFQAAPGTIIFDNACQASRYCLRREPLFFCKTRYLIDRLHQHNHVVCHSGYNMKFRPQSTSLLGGKMTLGELNSQAAEQAHAKLELISKQASFMRQDTFLRYTKLFLAMKNKTLLKNLR